MARLLATIEKIENGYIAQFDRTLAYPAEDVWEALTQNQKLEKWFSNLKVKNLGKEGTIAFYMNDGTGSSFDMRITDFHDKAILEFEWGDGRVRFELSSLPNGTALVLKEFIGELTEHTPKDLAGWHVCLDVLSTLLKGQLMEFPKGEWEQYYAQYVKAVNRLKNNQ